ncbi:MAG: phosphatase PAP2 family protein [Clostridiales bacterium]|nr:phosphatase PAP2 family protein [Clostridiales bacterium]
MQFLKFLEGLRTPLGDAFFSTITHLGEETLFIVIGLFFYWCLSKKQGLRLLFIGFAGTVTNQFLKLLFRVPRPWVLDESFTIVESARAQATGYSFPSGHTQMSIGTFGAIAYMTRKKLVRIIGVAICILVPLSRMYLGVHTPADVLVSAAITVAMVFAFPWIMDRAEQKKHGLDLFFGIMAFIAAAMLVFIIVYPFPADIDMNNYTHGIENISKILGCILGAWLGVVIDRRYVNFDTRAAWWVHGIKLVLGAAIVFAIKALLKAPLNALCGNEYLADGVRYFLITVFGAGVWPMTFAPLNRLGKRA